MTHSNDSRRPRRTRRQFTVAALLLLASVGFARQVSAADPHSVFAASATVGGGPLRALAIDPDTPTTLYAGTYCFGVFKSLDGGDSWSAVNTGLTSTDVLALAIDPTTPATLYAGTNRGGVFKSLNSGGSWSAVSTGLTNMYVLALAIDPATPTTLYAGTDAGVFRSTNGGSSWSAVNTGLTNLGVLALAINPTTPTTLYAGTGGGVFKSLNGGSSWERSGLTETHITALAINPTMPTTLYAGTNGGGVFKSLNSGGSWSAVNTGLTNMYVLALAIDPATPTTLYAGVDGVFRSLNGGSSWSPVNTGLTNQYVFALAIDPATPATLYAGADGGVFKSRNGGSSWRATGLSGVVCGDGVIACGGWEQCDDGGESATCDADCTLPQCGDGTLNVTAGEQCDDGNRNPFDGCTNECAVCGDGRVTPPEECDDGNASSGDDCDAQCRRPHVVGTGTPESCTEAAFEAMLAAGSVSFSCGPAPVTITLTSEKAITAATTIDGGGRITLNGGPAVRIFTVDATVLDVRNLTIADGGGDWDGGISNFGTVSVTNSSFSGNNSAEHGVAIRNYQDTLTVTNSTFSGYSIAVVNQGTLAVTNSTLSGNGGAIDNFGTLTMTNSTLSGNRDFALVNSGATARLTNCTLSENGGAISNVPACTPEFVFCHDGSVTLTNTIIADSAGSNCGGPAPITDGGRNLQFPGTSCGVTIQSSLDPLLDPAGLKDNGGPTHTIALLPGSPAINTGDPDVCANPPVNGLDQRGYARPGTGHTQCSIGAYEADAFSSEPCVGDCGGTGSVTVDEIITLVNIVLGTAQAAACPHGVPRGADVNVALIIQAVSNALNGCGVSPAEQGCVTSGGTVTSAMCCASAGDFPDTCAIGACGCAPDASHAVRVCDCGTGSCFDGSGCVRR